MTGGSPVVTGTVLLDLTATKPERQRARTAALTQAPHGCDVDLIVGAIAVGSEAAALIRRHVIERGLSVTVKGEAYAVSAWVAALRTGDGTGVLL